MATRIVHAYPHLSNAYFAHVWRKYFRPAHVPRALGGIEHRRREEAISIQLVMRHRLSQSGLSHMLHMFDGISAYPSVRHECAARGVHTSLSTSTEGRDKEFARTVVNTTFLEHRS
eukprot:935842-Pyramimonas_sp.AAC.1